MKHMLSDAFDDEAQDAELEYPAWIKVGRRVWATGATARLKDDRLFLYMSEVSGAPPRTRRTLRR